MSTAADTARYYAAHRERLRIKAKHRRRTDVAAAILEDARRDDRKRGRENDLWIAFVRAVISKPCAYCGETVLRKTLDRIDNALGHTRENVTVACERCNNVRRDMPYAAWLVVANGMREARETGAFEGWRGAFHRRGVFRLSLPTSPRDARRRTAHSLATSAAALHDVRTAAEPCATGSVSAGAFQETRNRR